MRLGSGTIDPTERDECPFSMEDSVIRTGPKELAWKAALQLRRMALEKWGTGGISRLERELGKSEGWFKRHYHRDRPLRFPILFEALAVLGVNPACFVAELMRDEPFAEQELVPSTLPELGRLVSRLYPRAAEGTGGDMGEKLEELDELRYINPLTALNRLQELVPELDRSRLVYALNVAGSCHRMLLEFKESAGCAEMARSLAMEQGHRLAHGDNLQRWIYLLANLGRYDRALQLNVQALDLFIESGSRRKIGEAIVDRGYCLYYLDQFEASMRCYESALGSFREDLTPRYLFAAAQGRAMGLLKKDDLALARSAAWEAVVLARSSGSTLFLGQGIWLQGKIEAKHGGDQAEMKRFFYEAVGYLLESSPQDAALALLDLAKTQVEQGLPEKATETLEGLAEHNLFEMIDVRQVRTALMQLLALVRLRRPLTVNRLSECSQTIEANRVRIFRAHAA